MADSRIEIRFECLQDNCARKNLKILQTRVPKYQLAVWAMAFHTLHEGHPFEYQENGEVVLGRDSLREGLWSSVDGDVPA